MQVRLNFDKGFNGRIFTHSEDNNSQCFLMGKGQKRITLRLNLDIPFRKRCAIQKVLIKIFNLILEFF